MDFFLKSAAAVLIAVVVSLILGKQNKDLSILLTIAVCSMILISAQTFLDPIIDFFKKLQQLGQLNTKLFGILLKAVGIGMIAEISGLICTDGGNSAMGKAMQLLATLVIIWISLPLFNELIDLIQRILEAV